MNLLKPIKLLMEITTLTVIILDIDDNGSRGHEKKLFKRRFRLDVR